MKSLDLGDDCSHKLTTYRRFRSGGDGVVPWWCSSAKLIFFKHDQHIFIIEEDMAMLFIRLLLLANNANKDLTQDTNFYVENPYGKNHGRQPMIFAI
jgi:hypothetical protein